MNEHGFTLDGIKRAQDRYEELHKYNDQLWKSDEIRRLLREQGLIVLRTKTTASQLEFDLAESLRYSWWMIG